MASSRIPVIVIVNDVPLFGRLTWPVNACECTLHIVAHAISAWHLLGIALDLLSAA